ncbi:asparaginase domain-containing protein [Allokutzneria sp. A3M-2-11 16]|uniref:asparaginase domain-containing protein n=1 Tax=Allokutzneria sp. A3M-2-11 16 TaxID=2962043 RepID=UPI0020B6AD51|nr:asparaginase domain-containing protein [Allokutzneria sp. A3M-2-11 16]MCP3801985.1 asparaginase domain-containing protein [Allokutzneria sp. A3M-2-11 16]
MITLGGTIAMAPTTDRAGVAPSLTADDLLAAVPGLVNTGITLRTTTFRALPSASLGIADLVELATLITSELNSGADGPANLLATIPVAGSGVCRGLGCLVVLNDEIHAARYLRNTHTTATSAFASPNL